MYKCCDCGRIFNEPVEQREYSEYWGIGKTTGYYVSPCCKTAFDEIAKGYDEDDEEEDEYAV